MAAYAGFPAFNAPGIEKARKGSTKIRQQATEYIPEWSMAWRVGDPHAEAVAHGRRLVAFYTSNDRPGFPPWPENVNAPKPDVIVAYGLTTRQPLVTYYLVDWAEEPDVLPTPGVHP